MDAVGSLNYYRYIHFAEISIQYQLTRCWFSSCWNIQRIGGSTPRLKVIRDSVIQLIDEF